MPNSTIERSTCSDSLALLPASLVRRPAIRVPPPGSATVAYWTYPSASRAIAPASSWTSVGWTIHGCRAVSAATQPDWFAATAGMTPNRKTRISQRLENSVPR